MKIKSLVIDGIAGIQHLELHFSKRINMICGVNGIGKTTILDVIADAFNADASGKLKRNSLFKTGKYVIEIENEGHNGISTSDRKEVVNREERDAILEQYHLLKEMLHPDNPICRLLSGKSLHGGRIYKYFMVFQTKNPDYEGAYSDDKFMEIVREL